MEGLKLLFGLLVLCVLIWLIAASQGCATQGNSVTLPRLPEWIAPNDTRIVTQNEARIKIYTLSPSTVINVGGQSYTLVSKKWLDEYLDWCWEVAKIDGIVYTPESFDCKAFTKLFDGLAGLAAARAHVQTAPLIGRLVVQLDANTRHELAGVATDEGIFVVEPQPDAGPFRATPLAKYPNKILSVTLGDFNP